MQTQEHANCEESKGKRWCIFGLNKQTTHPPTREAAPRFLRVEGVPDCVRTTTESTSTSQRYIRGGAVTSRWRVDSRTNIRNASEKSKAPNTYTPTYHFLKTFSVRDYDETDWRGQTHYTAAQRTGQRRNNKAKETTTTKATETKGKERGRKTTGTRTTGNHRAGTDKDTDTDTDKDAGRRKQNTQLHPAEARCMPCSRATALKLHRVITRSPTHTRANTRKHAHTHAHVNARKHIS